MTKKISKLITVVFCLSALFVSVNVSADEKLWQSGPNLFIKLSKQDKNSSGQRIPNQHPVTLNPNEIRNALSQITVWNKSFFTGALKDDEEAETVFSPAQARNLGTHIASGLKKAAPNQDITFALSRQTKRFLFLKDVTYTAGRVFYANDRLHVIIGDYDKLGDSFKERAHASHGAGEVKYYFSPGKRAKRSGFKKAIIENEGITTYKDMEKNKNRPDWFVINVKVASDTFLAEQAGADPQQQANSVNDELLRREAAKLAKERREMRLEMARLRKEMNNGGGSDTPIEERLAKLEKLKENKIITDEEYAAKRKEILADL